MGIWNDRLRESVSLSSATTPFSFFAGKELRTRRRPYHQFHSDGPMIFAIASGLLPDLRSELSDSGDDTLKKVCRQCWQRDPTKRATMHDILMMLSPSGENSSEHDIRKHQRSTSDR